jgi:hypothetical protein
MLPTNQQKRIPEWIALKVTKRLLDLQRPKYHIGTLFTEEIRSLTSERTALELSVQVQQKEKSNLQSRHSIVKSSYEEAQAEVTRLKDLSNVSETRSIKSTICGDRYQFLNNLKLAAFINMGQSSSYWPKKYRNIRRGSNGFLSDRSGCM